MFILYILNLRSFFYILIVFSNVFEKLISKIEHRVEARTLLNEFISAHSLKKNVFSTYICFFIISLHSHLLNFWKLIMMSFMKLFKSPVQSENISLKTMNEIDACMKRDSCIRVISFDSFLLLFFLTIFLSIQMIYFINILIIFLMIINIDFNDIFTSMLSRKIKYRILLFMN